MSGAVFYVRVGAKEHGPFDADKLKRLAAAGKLARHDMVSKDRQKWIPAGNVKGLFPPAELITRDPPLPIPTVVPPVAPFAPAPPPLYIEPQPQVVYVQASPPHVTQSVVVNVGSQGNTCAIVSAIFGLMALAFCWIPFLGLLTIPLAALAALLGGIGAIIALTRSGTGLVASICGGTVALLAIAISVMSTGAAVSAGAAAAAESVKAFEEANAKATAEFEAEMKKAQQDLRKRKAD